MKIFLAIAILGFIGASQAQTCDNSEITGFFDCVVDNFKPSAEDEAKTDEALACFTSAGCKTPEEVKNCVIDELLETAVPEMKACVGNKTDIPLPDPSKLREMKLPILSGLRRMAAKGKGKGKGRGGVENKIQEKLALLCNGDAEKAGQVGTCLRALIEGGSGGAEGGSGEAAGGSGEVAGGLREAGGLLRKLGGLRTCLNNLSQPCKQKLMAAKDAVCCCAKETDVKSDVKAAVGSCGVDAADFGKMGGELQSLMSKLCRKTNCSPSDPAGSGESGESGGD